MKRMLVVGGSIGVTLIFLLAGISTCACAQTISTSKEINSMVSKLKTLKATDERINIINIIQQISKEKDFSWKQDGLINEILSFLSFILIYIIGWMLQGHQP